MREEETPHSGVPCDLCRLRRGAVEGMMCSVYLFLAERRLVNQDVGPAGSLHGTRRRSCVSGVYHGPARPGRTHQVGGADGLTLDLHVLSPMEATEEGSIGNSELAGEIDVEASETVLFYQGPAHRGRPVLDLEGVDPVLVCTESFPGAALDQLYAEGNPLAPQRDHVLERSRRPRRSVQRDGIRATLQRHGPEQAGDAEHMVGVQMRDEHEPNVEARRVAHHLALRALSAIEEEQRALPLNR